MLSADANALDGFVRSYGDVGLLVENLNNKFLNVLGDVVVYFENGMPKLYEEYIADCIKMVGED